MTIAMRGSPAAGGDSSPQDPPPVTNAPTTSTPSPPATTATTAPATTSDSPPSVPTPSTSMVTLDDSVPVPQEEGQHPIPVQHEESAGAGEGTENEQENEMEGTSSFNDIQEFPVTELTKLDEMISRPRWVVPVLPKGELEILLEAAIAMCKKGIDTQSEACQRFFRDGLTTSFTKILTDEAVSGWKYEIHRCIMKNCERLIELCVIKLNQDWFPLLEMLAMVLNPANKFHTYNGTRQSDSVPNNAALKDDELYARCPDARAPKGWLVDLVNLFGKLGGFDILLERFTNGPNLSVPVIAALIKPFGLCFDVLTPHTVEKYFMPVVKIVPEFLNSLTDEELKKESNEAKNEAKNDALTGIIKALKYLTWRVPKQEETTKNLEMFRLKMILRLLQISSFNGKMNALNEVNKVLASVTYYSHRHGHGTGAATATSSTTQMDDDEWLTADKMAEWIQENNVLDIVLRDSLHQPQYVEKLEKIIRFMIKEKALTLPDLDRIWLAQAGKHEAIVKNVHDLLAKLAWDFTPEQLDHLFDCFQASWVNASKKQREKLLELIRRLAEDDKEGVMANKVLGLLWNLAHSEDVPTEIMDQALTSHIKILDYSCSQDRDAQKLQWISRFVEELKNDKWVLPALKQIREICQLFSEAPQNYTQPQRSSQVYYRNRVISQLQKQHSIVMLVAQNLTSYMNRARSFARDNADIDPADILPDGRFNHLYQVQERLRFLRFLLKDGQLWLCEPQAKQIWVCLAENAIYECDRENCFKWFSKLMGEEPDLDPEITKDFFESNILQFDPSLLTENGMNCFERFFKFTNTKESKLITKRRGGHLMDDLDLIGMEYLWRVVLYSPDDVAEKGIQLLKDVYTNLGPRLQAEQVKIHEDFLMTCMDRLKASYDTICVLVRGDSTTVAEGATERALSAGRMIRVLTVLREYVAECDDAHGEERAILPLGRACRGKHVTLVVRFPNQGRQVEDLDIWSHTNDTMGGVRRQILQRVKANNANLKIDLFINGDLLDQSEDRKLISQLNIRDKTLITAKLSQVGANMPSDPDSSSDSSAAGSPGHQAYDGPNIEAENCLPGVIMANLKKYAEFLFQLADMGSQLEIPKLRECARQILKIMPADTHTCEVLRSICAEHAKKPADASISSKLEAQFFGTSSAQVLYTLEVCFAMLMPAQNTMSEEAFDFQLNFMKSGGVPLSLSMLTKNNFLPNADLSTRRAAYHVVLKITKLLLTSVGHAQVQLVAEAFQSGGESPGISAQTHNQAVVLQQALHTIPNPTAECMTRSVASKLGHQLGTEIQRAVGSATSPVHKSGTTVMEILGITLELSTIKALQKLAWAASCGQLRLLHASNDDIHRAHASSPGASPDISPGVSEDGAGDTAVCREALELLAVALTLCPQALDSLNKDKEWQAFIIDILLLSKSRSIRATGTEQFLLLATKCCAGSRPLLFFITLLFTVLGSTAKDNARQSHEYFQLLCKLLNYACQSQVSVPTAEALLNNEIQWLKGVRDQVLKTGLAGDGAGPDEALLEGHLGVTRELLAFQPAEKKHYIGCQPGGINLIKEVIDDFIFPASKMVLRSRSGGKGGGGEAGGEQAIPVCGSQASMTAAFDLLVALCTGCVQGLKTVAETLTEMYYSGEEHALLEWEYLPAIGPRPPKGFVGLKNAGATCYMNSVLQQLFMIDPIRTYILQVEGAADENLDDVLDVIDGEKEADNTGVMETHPTQAIEEEGGGSKMTEKNEERKDYNLVVLKHVQVIFAHLACSKLQYYVPRGFWKHFRLCGEAVNLREQHDAVEFFNSVVDSIDEALKTLKCKPVFSKVMGGSFADQKICKDCPHRYSREEGFTVISIDIRNQQNLLESLEQYVKGDLLEGANAYHCERCNKKVDTVKRLCIKKLPPILAIQLKRFDYDWERECAIKFNDYFEFPREVDMEPYTAQGLAKIEGEVIADDDEDVESVKLGGSGGVGGGSGATMSTKYRLVGVVVHSGQASGGHYYSYILHRVGDQPPKWYKFDDGEVTECKMDEEEELKTQCFGGEYLGEVFDHMLKRMSYKRQKRWWNAYILMYERIDDEQHTETEKELAKSMQDLTIDNRTSQVRMPASIEKCVRKQNIQFMHNKTQFCPEYFQFMRKLLSCNTPYVQLPHGQEALSPEAEELAMISVRLASKFLFSVGFHTKKTLRGPANEWYDTLSHHLRHSKKVRLWFAQNVLFRHPSRFAEYLLECPSTEVRNAFMKIIVFLAHFSLQDGPCPAALSHGVVLPEPLTAATATLSDHLLYAVLQLLKKEVSEHGRHLTQYFHLFLMYANLGACEKQQLLRLNVPATFMTVVLEEGPGPPIKYQYAELGKLYAVVSQLVRCCDVSARCQSSVAGQTPLPNPHGDAALDGYIMPIQTAVVEILYARTSYVKKLLEDCNSAEDTGKLLKYCSWENPHFSSTVLSELLWQVAYTYTYELRPYLDLLLQMLMLDDSWQNHRIHNALKGIPEDRDGLFDTIGRSKNHYQKRAYQCIKMMVSLFTHCAPAANMLQTNQDLRRKWTWAVEWLNDELERRPYSGNTQYTYNNWSPPAQSNETSNGYFLERSHSARMTLTKAFELCPEEEEADITAETEGATSTPGSAAVPTTPPAGVMEVEGGLASAGDHDVSATSPTVSTASPEKQPASPQTQAPVHLPKPDAPAVSMSSPEIDAPKQDKDTGEKSTADPPHSKSMEHLAGDLLLD